MNISTLKSLFSEVPKIVLPFVILSSIVFGVFSWLNRSNTIYGQLPRLSIPSQLVYDTKWSLGQLKIPNDKKFPVYLVNKRSFTKKEANALATKLGFTETLILRKNTNEEENYFIKNKQKEIYINATTGEVLFKDFTKPKLVQANKSLNKEQAISVSEKFLSDLGIDLTYFNTTSPVFAYYIVGSSLEMGEATLEKGNIVTVSFPLEINNQSIYSSGGKEYISVTLTNRNEIYSLAFSKVNIQDEEATYPLSSESEVKKQLETGKGRLVSFEGEDYIAVPDEIAPGQGSVILYDDKKTEYIQPVYIFDSLVYKNLRNLKAKVYLPAVSAKFLK